MDEAEGRAWLVSAFGVSRETMVRLDLLTVLVLDEAKLQNLVSASTVPDFFVRHIIDSAQLLVHAPNDGLWLDLGSGAGFPGLVIALLSERPVALVESRAKRHSFLRSTVDTLGLTNVTVHGRAVEAIESFPAAVISARAFAPLDRLLPLASRFATDNTVWVLPKGRSAAEELAKIVPSWHGSFRMEPSLTDAESAIIVASGVRPKGPMR